MLPRSVQLSLGQTSTLPARPSASRRLTPHAGSPTVIKSSNLPIENQDVRPSLAVQRSRPDCDRNRQLTDKWFLHRRNRNTGVNLSSIRSVQAGSGGCEVLAGAAGAQPAINAFDTFGRQLSRPTIEREDIRDEFVLRLEQVTTRPEFVAYAGQYIDGIDHSVIERFLCGHSGQLCRGQGVSARTDLFSARIGGQVSAGDLLDHPAPDRFQFLLGSNLILVEPCLLYTSPSPRD